MRRAKNVIIVVLLVVIGAITYYCLCKKPEKTAVPGIPAYLEKSVSSEWQEFMPEGKEFSLLFPAAVQHASATQPFGQQGELVQYDVYSAKASDGTSYMLSKVVYPASLDTRDPQSILQQLLQDMTTTSPQNEIIGQTESTFLTYPALEFDLQNIHYATLGKAVLIDKTLYVLTVMDQDRNQLESHFHTFVGSFKLDETRK
jgi:hypothetical protein